MEPLIAGPLNAQCGKCLYWEQNETVATMGECRRYPPQVVMVRDSDDDGATFRWELSFQLLGVAISRYSELETAGQAAAFLEGEVKWKMRGLASFLNWITRNQP